MFDVKFSLELKPQSNLHPSHTNSKLLKIFFLVLYIFVKFSLKLEINVNLETLIKYEAILLQLQK